MRGLRPIAFGVLLALGCGHAQEPQEPPPSDPLADVDPEVLMGQGVGLARAGDLVRAEQYIVAAIGRGYDRQEAMPILLRVCVGASRLRAALTYAEPYLRENPRDWSLRFLVASIHQGLGEVPQARRELETVIEAQPGQADPHYALAVLLRDEVGDVVSSDTHFRRYLELDPDGEYAEEVAHSLRRIPVPQPPEHVCDGPDCDEREPVGETDPEENRDPPEDGKTGW